MSNMEEHGLYLIVSTPDLCTLTYFDSNTCAQNSIACRMLSVISKFIY